MSQHSINQDYAHHDRRSVTAMLHGYGDRREQEFLKFAAKHPALDTLALMEHYRLYQCKQAALPWYKRRAFAWGVWIVLLESLEFWYVLQILELRAQLPF